MFSFFHHYFTLHSFKMSRNHYLKLQVIQINLYAFGGLCIYLDLYLEQHGLYIVSQYISLSLLSQPTFIASHQ